MLLEYAPGAGHALEQHHFGYFRVEAKHHGKTLRVNCGKSMNASNCGDCDALQNICNMAAALCMECFDSVSIVATIDGSMYRADRSIK